MSSQKHVQKQRRKSQVTFHTSPKEVSLKLALICSGSFIISGLLLYTIITFKSSVSSENYGNFYLDIQTRPRECISMHNKLGDFQETISVGNSDLVQPRGSSYCQKLWKLLHQCFTERTSQSNLIGQHREVDTANHSQSHPNILLVLSNPRAERPDLFLDLFLTHFLQNYQNKVNRTIRHTPTISCHSFISAYDLQDRKGENSIIVYGPQTLGIHSILYQKRPYVYLIWVENPVERFVKLFLNQQRTGFASMPALSGKNNDYFLSLMERSDNLTEFIQQTKHSQVPYLDNYLTRLLSFNLASETSACNTGTRDHSEMDQSHFEKATSALQEVNVYVALASEPELSLKHICSLFDMSATCFGKSALGKLEKGNKLTIEENMTEELRNSNVLNEIVRRNRWDMQLVDYLTELFRQQTSHLRS